MSFTRVLGTLAGSMRFWVVLLVIVAACAFTTMHAEHHTHPNVFQSLYMHLMPAKLLAGHDGGYIEVVLPAWLAFFDMDKGREGVQLIATNLQVFQLAAVVLIFVCFSGVPGYLRSGKGDWLTRIFAGFAGWVRDEMVYATLGKENGRKLAPYFLTLFFFILFMNLMGLVPHSATATASIFVTGALAVLTFVSMLGCGMVAQGPLAFWKNLVPHVPAAIWPLMLVVELAGLVIKPFALMIRLFANMTGGHMVVLSFMGLIFYFSTLAGPAVGWASSPVALAFAVFIMIIEAFVALLQAYIFTQLTLLFVGASIHPEH